MTSPAEHVERLKKLHEIRARGATGHYRPDHYAAERDALAWALQLQSRVAALEGVLGGLIPPELHGPLKIHAHPEEKMNLTVSFSSPFVKRWWHEPDKKEPNHAD